MWQLVDLPTDALLSHLHNGSSPPLFHSPPVPPMAPFDPAYYQVVVDDTNLNNNNYVPLKVARRPLSVIHEESLFNHFL